MKALRPVTVALAISFLPFLPFAAVGPYVPHLPALGASSPTPTTSNLTLYRQEGPELVPVNQQTLTDIPAMASINLGNAKWPMPWIFATPNGSTAFAAYQGDVHNGFKTRITVVDGSSGGVLKQLQLPFFPEAVTSAGDLYGWAAVPAAKHFSLWEVYTQGVIHRVRLAQLCCLNSFYDSARHRLYTLNPTAEKGSAPRTLVVSAYDVLTGRRVASRHFGGVLAGWWTLKRKIHSHPVTETHRPGAALSPDGTQLAILDGHRDVLILVNTNALKVRANFPLAVSPSLLEQAASWLGLAAPSAEAKSFQGEMINLRYSPNGSRLYETGIISSISADGKDVIDGLGLRSIDPGSGQIVARQFDHDQVGIDWVAPDGSGIYASACVARCEAPSVYRFDPSNLQIEASQVVSASAPGTALVLMPVAARPLRCEPPSPSIDFATQGNVPHGSLWGLGVGALPAAGKSAKIVWRMTGKGPLRMFAEQPDGTRIAPDWGPDQHIGSVWLGTVDPPGDDYGSGWTFPKPGCWRIHAARDNVAGDVWFQVQPSS